MCDYSLMGVPNRLANEGEDLVVHRFRTGSIGLISDHDLAEVKAAGVWATLKGLFHSSGPTQATAVCIAPGARLLLRDIPEELQRSIKIGGSEEVVFTQLTAEVNTYRDAVRFGNGAELLLQRLREGQRVKVLRMSLSPESAGTGESGFANTPLATL
ncbi:MAG TPA: hypothetical protein VFB23_02540 [Candidatus Acidoferrales bacterium]|nr:hypothetical protein [Candidatus Acidoferrales bacterium]